MSSEKKLISFEQAANLNDGKTRQLASEFLNPGLIKTLGLLGFDRVYREAQGVVLKDDEGNEYMDFLGGFGSLNLGHNPEVVLEAMQKVSSRPNILHVSLNPFSAALAYNLAQIAPGDLSRTFFCNSGTEAVEGALKLARAAAGKKSIVYCENSFHGKSMGSLSVTGRDKYQKEFLPLIPQCHSIPFGDTEALEKVLSVMDDVAAFIVEPIQGEGGIVVPPKGYLRRVREICSEFNVLLILDEIQTGFGRTGKMFACEHEDVEPDILCLAKSLGGGMMPVGAFMTTPKIWDKAYGAMDKSSLHTSTFGGNAMAMAASLAALQELIEKDISSESDKKGRYFMERLRERISGHPLVKEIRGKGLLIGIEFNGPGDVLDRLTGGLAGKISEEYAAALVAGELLNNHRIITAYSLNNPNVIRLEPPLIVSYQQLDKVVGALDEVLQRNTSTIKVAFSGVKTALHSLVNKIKK